MTHYPIPLYIIDTLDSISTAIVVTICDIALTNRTWDLPKQSCKQSTGFAQT